jgi:putative heme transporter
VQPNNGEQRPSLETAEAPERLQTTQAPGALEAARAQANQELDSEQAPRVAVTRKTVIGSIVMVVVIVAFLYFGLPRLVGVGTEVKKLQDGNVWWLIAAAVLKIASFVGYIALFRAVFVHRMSAAGAARLSWKVSYEITMAGLAATRVFAAAGAGGIVLTVWALLRAGLDNRLVAARMIAFNVILYGVYMGALVVFGLGLYLGLFSGEAPFAVTVVPAAVGGAVIGLVLSIAALPSDFENLVVRWARSSGRGRFAKLARRLATVPASAAQGVRTTLQLIRTGDPSLLGALVWWFCDIATLWACFHAFGAAPPDAVIVMAYFVGWIANTLPTPGGIGTVEGGLIGTFAAFGVPTSTAVIAVLAYRVFSFWLPTPPGVVAYFQLRRTVNRWRQEPLPTPALQPDSTLEPGSATG